MYQNLWLAIKTKNGTHATFPANIPAAQPHVNQIGNYFRLVLDLPAAREMRITVREGDIPNARVDKAIPNRPAIITGFLPIVSRSAQNASTAHPGESETQYIPEIFVQ